MDTQELTPVVRGVAIALDAAPPLAAAALGGRFYVAAREPSSSGEATRLVVLDGEGRAAGAPARFPIALTGLASCAGELVLAGERTRDHQPIVLGLDAAGAQKWIASPASSGPLEMGPLPVCLGDRRFVVWTAGRPVTLTVLELGAGGAVGDRSTAALADSTYAIGVAAVAGGLTVWRTHGPEVGIELIRVAGGVVHRAALEGASMVVSPTAIAAGDRLGVAWIGASGARFRFLDGELRPLGAAVELHVPGAAPTALWALPAPSGRAALWWRARTGGQDWAQLPGGGSGPGRVEPQPRQRESVAALDLATLAVGAPRELVPAGARLLAAASSGERLLIVHGLDRPFASIYR